MLTNASLRKRACAVADGKGIHSALAACVWCTLPRYRMTTCWILCTYFVFDLIQTKTNMLLIKPF